MKGNIKRFESKVFIVRKTQVLAYFPFATLILRTVVLYFWLAFLNAIHCLQMPCLAQAPTQPHCLYQSPIGRKQKCTIFLANEKHMVLKCACDNSFERSRWNNMVCPKRSIVDVSIHSIFSIFLRYSDIILLRMERWVVYTSYHIRLIS